MDYHVLLVTILLLVEFFDVSNARRNRRARMKSLQTDPPGDLSGYESLFAASNAHFGEWGPWSKCHRNCRQNKQRKCIQPDVCGDLSQKITRTCVPPGGTSQCRDQKAAEEVAPPPSSSEDDKRSSKFNVLTHLTPYVYGSWSSWTACTSSCFAKRYRMCKFPELCGSRSVVEDYKICYKENEICEKRYKEYLKQRNSTQEDDSPFLANVTCGISEVNAELRITGGRRAVKGSWPWQVLLLNDRQEPFCGGVLLSDRWVLTAAHCTRDGLWARAGEHDLSTHEGTEQQEKVDTLLRYPGYDPETVDSDIALLRVRRPFRLDNHVRPICLPKLGDKLPLFSRATILGWGKRRNLSAYGTDILHQAEVPIAPPAECRASYSGHRISEGMICAGFATGRVDSCRGDSGGPLMHRATPGGAWTVFGVTSFGDGCGQRRKYGVYASVPNHLAWIRGVLRMGEKFGREERTMQNVDATTDQDMY